MRFDFGQSFISHPRYNGDLNGIDVMIMESHEKADKIIEEIKNGIDTYGLSFTYTYDTDELLETDQRRINQEIEKYCTSRGMKLR